MLDPEIDKALERVALNQRVVGAHLAVMVNEMSMLMRYLHDRSQPRPARQRRPKSHVDRVGNLVTFSKRGQP